MLLNDCANTEYIKGCSNRTPTRPQAQQPPEAYPLGYVEDGCKPRTKFATCFSSLYSTTVSRHSGIMALMPYRA